MAELPSSGEVIGMLVDAFGGAADMPEPIVDLLGNRTSRRMFRGEGTRRRCCRLTALQLMLLFRKLITLPEVFIDGAERSTGLLSVVMMSEVAWWDALPHGIDRRRARLRYVAVDAAIRLRGLLGDDALDSELFRPRPAWAERSRRGELVRALLEQVPGTNADHAKALCRTPSMVSAWKTGKARPTVHTIHDLATHIGKVDRRGVAGVEALLHWHYALEELAHAIAVVEGTEFVVDLASVFVRSIACKAARSRKDVPPMVRLRLFALPLWQMPADAREAILVSARNHGASDEWLTDVRDVCAEYAALKDPDTLVRRACSKHPHAFWGVQRARPRAQVRRPKLPARRTII